MIILKMQSGSRVWNLGDTSFRRNKLLDDYSSLLNVLEKFNSSNLVWDNVGQKEFYIMVLKETELLEDTSISEELDRRARTITNGLNKLGLCNNLREVTKVGLDLLEYDKGIFELEKDNLEKKLNISGKNILLLRQMLKFRIFNSDEKKSFNPFLIALAFFMEYDSLEAEHFKRIVQNLYFDQDYKNLVKNYTYVKDGSLEFEDYIKDNLLKDLEDLGKEEKHYLLEFYEKDTNFREIFKNRKTAISVDKYEHFYESLKNVRNDFNNNIYDEENLKKLIRHIRNNKIKKAFSTNEYFDIPKRGLNDVKTFYENNKENHIFFLSDKEFRKKIYLMFLTSKTKDLINEYHDVTIRTFNLTGILDFSSGRVRISKKYFNDLIKENRDIIFNLLDKNIHSNMEKYYEYLHSDWITTLDTLQIDSKVVEEFNKKTMLKEKVKDIQDLDKYYLKLEDKEFLKFIDSKFPNDKLISILKNIRNRNDEFVFKEVTDNATISTIFEYIMGIAWYRISSSYNKYSILKSLNLSLDGSFLPLSHAIGGEGDIIIDYKNHVLMLEVTLMDLSNQRRNELEPVIRHTTNLSIRKSPKPVLTFFVANEIDYNTSTIFRMCSFIKLKSTTGSEEYSKNGIKIFSLKINEIIELLEKNKSYEDIHNNVIEEYNKDKNDLIDYNWRESLMEKIL